MSYMDDSDEVLIERYARGDVAAFDVLYRRHELRTWRYLERNVGSHSVADELMQALWFAVARDSVSYEPKGRFAKWLFSIAHQRVAEYAKASQARPVVPAAAPEEQSVLTKALAQLPREPRDAYLLHIEGELTVEEISAVTHCAAEMTQARLLYARTMLNELLSEQQPVKQNTSAPPAQKAPARVITARRPAIPTEIPPVIRARPPARLEPAAAISRGGHTESTSPADTPSASQAISVPRNDTLVVAAASAAATNPAVAAPPALPVMPVTAKLEVWIS